MTTLNATHKAIVNAQSVYQKNIHDAETYPYNVIKRNTGAKLGRVVKKTRLRGAKIYVLTLEERTTCDPDCEHWLDCFGNNMPYAHRFKANTALLGAISKNLDEIDAKGHIYLVRLHILGDFYSLEYVDFWQDQLERRPLLNIYGYTRNTPNSRIPKYSALGLAILNVRIKYPDRFAVRFSNDPSDKFSANSEHVSLDGIVCPEQTGHTESCGNCGLCWTMKEKPVIFLDH